MEYSFFLFVEPLGIYVAAVGEFHEDSGACGIQPRTVWVVSGTSMTGLGVRGRSPYTIFVAVGGMGREALTVRANW